MSGTRPLTRNPLIQWQRLVDDNLNSLGEGRSVVNRTPVTVNHIITGLSTGDSRSRIRDCKHSMARPTPKLCTDDAIVYTDPVSFTLNSPDPMPLDVATLEVQSKSRSNQNPKQIAGKDKDRSSNASIKIRPVHEKCFVVKRPKEQTSSLILQNSIGEQYEERESTVKSNLSEVCETGTPSAVDFVLDTQACEPSSAVIFVPDQKQICLPHCNSSCQQKYVLSGREYDVHTQTSVSCIDRGLSNTKTKWNPPDSIQKASLLNNLIVLRHTKPATSETMQCDSTFDKNVFSFKTDSKTYRSITSTNLQRFFYFLDLKSSEQPQVVTYMVCNLERLDNWNNIRFSSLQACTEFGPNFKKRLFSYKNEKENIHISSKPLEVLKKWNTMRSQTFSFSSSKLKLTQTEMGRVDFGAGGDLTFQIREGHNIEEIGKLSTTPDPFQETLMEHFLPEGQNFTSDSKSHFENLVTETDTVDKKQLSSNEVRDRRSQRLISCKLKPSRFLQRTDNIVESTEHLISEPRLKTKGIVKKDMGKSSNFPTLEHTAPNRVSSGAFNLAGGNISDNISDKSDILSIQRASHVNDKEDDCYIKLKSTGVAIEGIRQFSSLKMDKDFRQPESILEERFPLTKTNKRICNNTISEVHSLLDLEGKINDCQAAKGPRKQKLELSAMRELCTPKKTEHQNIPIYTMPHPYYNTDDNISPIHTEINCNVLRSPEKTTRIALVDECEKDKFVLEDGNTYLSYINANKKIEELTADIDITSFLASNPKKDTKTFVPYLWEEGNDVLRICPNIEEEKLEIVVKNKERVSSRIIERNEKCFPDALRNHWKHRDARTVSSAKGKCQPGNESHSVQLDQTEPFDKARSPVLAHINDVKLDVPDNSSARALGISILKERNSKSRNRKNCISSCNERSRDINPRERAGTAEDADLVKGNGLYKMSILTVQPGKICDFQETYVNKLFNPTELLLPKFQQDKEKPETQIVDKVEKQTAKSANHDDLSQSSLECLLEQLIHRGKITKAFVISLDKNILAHSKDTVMPHDDVTHLFDGLMGRYNGLMKITLSDVVYTCFQCDGHTVLMGRSSDSVLVAKLGSSSVTVGFASPQTNGSCLKEIIEFARVLSGRGL